MKAGIHPDYHEITVVMTDGTKYKTRSTWGKAGDVLQLDIDPKTHAAWTGGTQLRKTGQMEKFNNKFGKMAALGGKSAAASADAVPKDAAPKAAAEDKKKKDDKK